jgi:hypothetical protein
MKKICVLFLVFLFLVSYDVRAKGAAAPEQDESTPSLTNKISVAEVSLSRKNRLAGYNESRYSCENFKGTHAGNTIVFKAEAFGGRAPYKHLLSYQLTSDFAFEEKAVGPLQYEESRNGNGEFKIKLPELDPQVPFVDLTVFLVSSDSQRIHASSSVTFRVSRTVLLTRSSNKTQREKSCFERYQAYLSAPGLISNGSMNTSRLEIRQGVDQIWSSSRGWQFGVYVSPFSWLGLGNLVALNYSHFQTRSKQVTESTYVSSSYELDPGDFLQVYVQPTRYVTAYDAAIVHPCGETRSFEGAYLFQWWAFSYHVYPIDPFSSVDEIDPTLVGVPPLNTCPQELESHDFRRTN